MPPERKPLLAALAAQQKTIDALTAYKDASQREIIVLKSQLHHLAEIAGLGPAMASIRKKADIDNPAQPVPAPPSEAPFETTEQALQSETHDNVQNPGQTPGSVQDLAADTTTTPLVPGEALPTSPYNDLVNVEAPVAGTETQRPLNETKIETDVRVGDPMAPQVAFPWTISSQRTMASIRLARLRIEAGLAQGDDLGLGQTIASDQSISDDAIDTEINTLSRVRQVQATRQRPAGLVPRAASGRTAPSLVSEAGQQYEPAATDEDAESLFD
jgi:hypothetical protein